MCPPCSASRTVRKADKMSEDRTAPYSLHGAVRSFSISAVCSQPLFCFICRFRRSAIIAMNSELVGLPLAELTV